MLQLAAMTLASLNTINTHRKLMADTLTSAATVVVSTLSVEEIKEWYDTKGRTSLLLCECCFTLDIKPLKTNAGTNFVKKKK